MKTDDIQNQLKQLSRKLLRFRVPLFLLLVALVYVFIIARADTLKTARPSQTSVAAQTTVSSRPHIDQVTINKIKQLQDNSVSVQALFNQARQNPFQE